MRTIALLWAGLFLGLLQTPSLSAQSTAQWMRYPAISPDGQAIVFSYKGDLFRVNSAGGQATPLTLHPAYDYMPIWSPDGQSLAFASDRYGNFDVYHMPATGGSARQLTVNSLPDVPEAFTQDGQRVHFTSPRLASQTSVAFPSRGFDNLHSVSVEADRPRMELAINLEHARPNKDGSRILYQDHKGYENYWRKHATSSVARDIWLFDSETNTHTQLTTFEGEDREAVWGPDGETVYYLSERAGSFNVWKMSLSDPDNPEQVTQFALHPVRFLSISNEGTLCFTHHSSLYTMNPGEQPEEVGVMVATDDKFNEVQLKRISRGITEATLSPSGKEVAFIVRGEVFVTALDYGTTKRITNTPTQERSVSFSPDGRSLLYAGERNDSWNLYETSIVRETEPYFYTSTLLEESTLLANSEETFQPSYSPDGKEVAYLSERTTLKVLNKESGQSRTVLPGNKNYSYSDGDQWFEWSPDGKWFLVEFLDRGRWVGEAGLVSATGTEPVINLTNSGYVDGIPQWKMDGNMLMWYSDRQGLRSHGSWGSSGDMYAMFFNQDSWDKFRLSKEDYELLQLMKEGEKEGDEDEEADDKKGKDEEEEKTPKKPWEIEPKVADEIEIDLEGMEDRIARLTIHSSDLAGAELSPKGDKLYYMASFEKGHDLWVTDLRSRETKVLTKLNRRGGYLKLDPEGKFLFVVNGGQMFRVDVESGNKKPITFMAEMELRPVDERAYMLNHMWRQVHDKFYDPELHGVPWDSLYNAYSALLPHINNNYDFAELASEFLGELNASHTGSGYRHRDPDGNQTASLAFFPDPDYNGDGLKILEIIDKSPLQKAKADIAAGHIIEAIDGVSIGANDNYFSLLNHKRGKRVLLSLLDPKSKKQWQVQVEPISLGAEGELLYQRWVETRRKETDEQSNGRVGYVHVRGMNSASFREVFSEVLGRYADREALIVDTRFNGGGWLHDDLATFLSGELYVTLEPRGQYVGSEPQNKWTKPSTVLMGESNYSDAHFFPYTYSTLDIGGTIGMPVPGTATAVWWETQIDPTIYFGIPQVGVKQVNGGYLENEQLAPDIEVKNEYGPQSEGKDQQLERAVKEMLNQAERKRLER